MNILFHYHHHNPPYVHCKKLTFIQHRLYLFDHWRLEIIGRFNGSTIQRWQSCFKPPNIDFSARWRNYNWWNCQIQDKFSWAFKNIQWPKLDMYQHISIYLMKSWNCQITMITIYNIVTATFLDMPIFEANHQIIPSDFLSVGDLDTILEKQQHELDYFINFAHTIWHKRLEFYHVNWKYARSKNAMMSWLDNKESPAWSEPKKIPSIQWFNWILWSESSRNTWIMISSGTFTSIKKRYIREQIFNLLKLHRGKATTPIFHVSR